MGLNKIVALVEDKQNKPYVIEWTKNASTVTVLDRFGNPERAVQTTEPKQTSANQNLLLVR